MATMQTMWRNYCAHDKCGRTYQQNTGAASHTRSARPAGKN